MRIVVYGFPPNQMCFQGAMIDGKKLNEKKNESQSKNRFIQATKMNYLIVFEETLIDCLSLSNPKDIHSGTFERFAINLTDRSDGTDEVKYTSSSR